MKKNEQTGRKVSLIEVRGQLGESWVIESTGKDLRKSWFTKTNVKERSKIKTEKCLLGCATKKPFVTFKRMVLMASPGSVNQIVSSPKGKDGQNRLLLQEANFKEKKKLGSN